MSKHKAGPVSPEFVDAMNKSMKALDFAFNGDLRGKDKKVGLVLLVYPIGEAPRKGPDHRCNYISNGADRRDMIKLLREQAQHFEDHLKETEGQAK